MHRSIRITAGLAVAALVAGTVSAAPSVGASPEAPRSAPTFTPFALSWSKPVANGRNISTSSPVVVANGGNPYVVAGDLGGNLRGFRLHDGATVSGWQSVNAGFEIKAPLSTDGSSVYVPVAQDGKDNLPQYKRYSANGSLQWQSRAGFVGPARGGFLLSGLALTKVGGSWRGYGGSSGHWMYSISGTSGKQSWAFRNAESTMATPALANLYGSGSAQVIFSNDKNRGDVVGGKNGGHLRIFTSDGKQICSADQLANGDTYRPSGYNNSSPAVAEIAGRPLIVFGSTGPTQTGVGGNQILAYDAACGRRWASAALAGQAAPSPTFADVLGTGTPQVIEMVSIQDSAPGQTNRRYPRVYVLDAATGQTLRDSGTQFRQYGANIAFSSASSVTTADVNGDGRQDLFVPGATMVVWDAQTSSVLQAIPTGGAIQNSPVITAEPGGGLRVTWAGYSGNNGTGSSGGFVRSFTTRSGSLGDRGWPEFGHDPQLTGLQGALHGPYNQIAEGQNLLARQSISNVPGGWKAAMQSDGNLVITNPDGKPTWSSRTNVAGSKLALRTTGLLEIVTPGGTVVWRGGKLANGVERLVIGADGKLKVYSATYGGVERTTTTKWVWSS